MKVECDQCGSFPDRAGLLTENHMAGDRCPAGYLDDHDCDGTLQVITPRAWTTDEIRWMARLQQVMRTMPESLGMYTIGGSYLTIYDRQTAIGMGVDGELWDGMADEHGLNTKTVRTLAPVHGVSG